MKPPLQHIYTLICDRIFKKTEFNSVRVFSRMFPWGGRKIRKQEEPTVQPVCAEAQGVGQSIVD
jgi:hypothetical protein